MKAFSKRSVFWRTGRRQTRLTIHLDRVRDPTLATPAARAELVMMLQGLVREIEQAQPAAQPHAS
jgi:hypothetical protein